MLGTTRAWPWVPWASMRKVCAAFKRRIEIEPGYATAWKNLGLALKSLKRDAEAKEALSRARELGLD